MIFSISTFFWGTLYYHHQHTTTQNASYFCLLVIAIKMKCNYIHFRLAGLEVEASHSKFLNEVSTVSFFFSPPSPPPKDKIIHKKFYIHTHVTRYSSHVATPQVRRSEEEADSWSVAPSKIPVGAFRCWLESSVEQRFFTRKSSTKIQRL